MVDDGCGMWDKIYNIKIFKFTPQCIYFLTVTEIVNNILVEEYHETQMRYAVN